MRNKLNALGIIFSVLLVSLLFLPAFQYLFHVIPEKPLFGYVAMTATKPTNLLTGWFNKNLQAYLEEKIARRIGFKPIIVRTFNELSFRIFAEDPRINLYSTPRYGLYSKMSIVHLNMEYRHREYFTKVYREFAKKTAQLQQLLTAEGKHFVVIISSSKPYIHPRELGKKLLINNDENLFSKVASIGRELEKEKVNVIDSGPLLRHFYKKKAIETHPYSGVHWNYYAGCLIAKQLLKNSKKTFNKLPVLTCGRPIYKQPEMVDIDGLLLLNVLSQVNLAKPTPYPTPSATFNANFLPKILLVGDSFQEQIVYALEQTKSYAQMVTSSYFKTHAVQHRNEPWHTVPNLSREQQQMAILDDALKSDLIVLQMVDYNSGRFGYGFVEALLTRLQEKKGG